MTPERPRWFVAAVALIVFVVADLSGDLLAVIPGYREAVRSLPDVIRWLWQPLRWAVLIALGLWVVHRIPAWRAGPELGFRRPFLLPLAFCAACSAPMTILPLFLAPLRTSLDPVHLLFSAGIWVLAEEVLFRGYCFRQLHRRAHWNLWVAAAATGVVFGLVHLGNAEIQSLPLAEQVPSIALIGIGGVMFAWLFAAWGDNIWVPFFIHAFMNLGWELWEIDTHPAAGWLVITLRVSVPALAITGTVLIHRSRPRALRRPSDGVTSGPGPGQPVGDGSHAVFSIPWREGASRGEDWGGSDAEGVSGGDGGGGGGDGGGD